MNLENFKKHIRILDKEEATRYRSLYIKKYVVEKINCTQS